jgi:transposase-like protein
LLFIGLSASSVLDVLQPYRRSLADSGLHATEPASTVQGMRPVDSTRAAIEFLLSARRDADAARRFFQKALRSPGHPLPRVINVDGILSYQKVVMELKRSGNSGVAAVAARFGT